MSFRRLSESSRPPSKPFLDRKPPRRMGPTTAPPICTNISFRNIARCLTPISPRSSLTKIASRSTIFASARMFRQTVRRASGSRAAGSGPPSLRATSDQLGACVIVGMMSTYDELIDQCVAPHTWMLFPAGWSRRGDWPDLAASAAPAPLLVQYLLDDAQFTVAGMRGADARMAAHYRSAGSAEAYRGEFYPGPHRFDAPMQESAFSWLKTHLRF